MGLGAIGSRGIRCFRRVPFLCSSPRSYTAPSYSTPAPVGISEAEVQSAKDYCSGLLQYILI